MNKIFLKNKGDEYKKVDRVGDSNAMTRMIKVMWGCRRIGQIYRLERIGGGTRKVILVELILKPSIMRNCLENIF